ncbi:hypothetical protein [Caldimonas brevitalea]|uniref:Uncharacterized protein n=1 Tax=Caldimonas brevitalea TaxID=413882 RepID=A0A0G3BIN2_9BURK|nr:hypothetical protein [Caldimonas brevitalea]AKJ29252.1 hypothetical protein AAW51_2561 [Caldimonas brevitalea]
MDSLARLTHSYTAEMANGERPNPVVTAVGLQQNNVSKNYRLAIAHNTQDAQQHADDLARLKLVRDVVVGRTSSAETAAYLAPDSGLPRRSHHGNLGAQDRLAKDLRKLRSTYDGNDDERGGARLKQALHNVFGTREEPKPINAVNLTMPPAGRGVVHGETALLAQSVPSPIGVSKLSCGDCDDYASEVGRNSDLRGTHGQRFPGWQHPTTGQVSHNRVITGAPQYANDSDSDA